MYLTIVVSFIALLVGIIVWLTLNSTAQSKELEIQLKEQKNKTKNHRKNLEILSEIGQNITALLSIEEIIEKAYDSINAIMDASGFGIGVYNEKTKKMDFPGFIEKGQKLDFHSVTLEDKGELTAWCWNHEKDVIINDLEKEAHLYFEKNVEVNVMIGEVPHSIIYLPIYRRKSQEKIGVLTVQSFRTAAYSNYHLFLLKNIAIYISIAMENAQAFQKSVAYSEKVGEENEAIMKSNRLLEKEKVFLGKLVLKEESQKTEIERQKLIIEKQSAQMLKGIKYANNIQQSILPKEEIIKLYLPYSFIYFAPKELVSGDFYWFHHVNGRSIISAIDCSGHGVPGAFITMIGNTLLNKIIKEERVVNPSEILNKLDANIFEVLTKKDGSRSVDGMDLSICVINHNEKKIEFAGARNNMYIINGEKHEKIEADTKSIGVLRKDSFKYTTREIKVEKEDWFYIMSDGYVDQFGENQEGPKKYGRRRLLEKLIALNQQDGKIQLQELERDMQEWKGSIEQIDDQLIIGFKV